MKKNSRGSNQQLSAPYNRRVVLDLIRQNGSISRKEIVEAVSLSPQTVANITNDLESIGLIISRRVNSIKLRGQPPIEFTLNPDAGGAIGITIEHGKVSAALVSLVGDVLLRGYAEVNTSDPKATLTSMIDLVGGLSSGIGNRAWGIGVALPGPLIATDISFVGPTSLEGWEDLSILDQLRDATKLPVFYSVDSVAGALGETLFGVAKSLNNFFYVHLGIGLGGVLVEDRSAYRGSNGNATEIGHIPAVKGGVPCYCGNVGCLERYLSLNSLAEVLGIESGRIHEFPIIELIENQNNPRFLEWAQIAASCLRDVICTVENMLDPKAIVIGGSAPKELVTYLIKLAQPLHKSVRGGIENGGERILFSDHQKDSSILGAAVLPLYDMLSPNFDVLQKDRKSDLSVAELLGHW
jgi:predicted NBD/HSP70 family sugar kinase